MPNAATAFPHAPLQALGACCLSSLGSLFFIFPLLWVFFTPSNPLSRFRCKPPVSRISPKKQRGQLPAFSSFKSFSQPWGRHFRPCTHQVSVSVPSASFVAKGSRLLVKPSPSRGWLLPPVHAHLNPEAQAVPDGRSRVGQGEAGGNMGS
ncbi:hypothetical protein LZ32DRAFT_295348 [Colletotrichum eremochloae]|nr:hypothetical protein LZ32DRAFT_295348 [Colletotrichum eremochloae]